MIFTFTIMYTLPLLIYSLFCLKFIAYSVWNFVAMATRLGRGRIWLTSWVGLQVTDTVRFLPRAVANLLCVHVNSASYPQRDGKWVVAYGLRGEGLVWLIGAVVCLLAANRVSNCSLMRATDGRIVRCGIISSCQSAATSEIVKRFRSRVWLT